MSVGVGVIGLGFMGATHVRGYGRLGDACRVVAVCDEDESRLGGTVGGGGNIGAHERERLFDPGEVFATPSVDALLARSDVEAVSICTPTETHVDLAIAAVRAGKHVLVEKPVATSSAEVERLVREAERHDRIVMPGMCVRFWPGWDWLRDVIADGRYGALRGLSIRRLASRPGWSAFYADAARSGGALFDLHIHDVDFACWCLGLPQSVAAAGSIDHMSALFRFGEEGLRVAIEGGWDHDAGMGFRMEYIAVFEGATAEFDLRRESALLVHRGGESEAVAISSGTGWDEEVRAFVESARGGAASPVAVGDALRVTRVLEAERAALDSGAWERVVA